MRKIKSYEAFTLVEMLIVMGIIIILMAVGIASGRFAIQRANKIEHQNAADQIYQAAQSYYTDNREFPATQTPDVLLTGDLAEYIDEFDGGSDATYTYVADGTGQQVLVCVSLGGHTDGNALGYYCTGNGLGTESAIENAPLTKDIEAGSDGYSTDFITLMNSSASNWYAGNNGWTNTPATGE